MTIARHFGLLLAASMAVSGGGSATASPVTATGMCGALHTADIQRFIAPPRKNYGYRWTQTGQAGSVITVRFDLNTTNGLWSLNGFQCKIVNGQMISIPYIYSPSGRR